MNHPNREEFVALLYGDLEGEAARQLKNHLRACPDCQKELAALKGTANRLNSWKLPRLTQPALVLQPFWRWALAGAFAGLVLWVGVGIGRLNPAADSRSARDEIVRQVRLELRQEIASLVQQEAGRNNSATLAACAEQTRQLLATYTRYMETNRLDQDAAYSAALENLYFTLKKEVDTVAVFTDAELRDTQRRLVQLVDYKPPSPQSRPIGN
jgi:hypothetical protein